MLLIQVVLIAALVVITGVLVHSTADARHQAVRRLLLVALVLLAVTSILVPGAVTRVAAWLGVGRGTDLVLYGTVVALLGFMASSYRRTRALEARLAQLTRQLALDEAASPVAGDDGEGPGT
ncbi:DUF2304 domain-containing protein [Kineococcus glutinatus]|uniref:DUF2304 domain-containing protein n=1 Tax=Kineococcus glutinatus TaxID=1070872 RepID=A0ABP9I8Y1_9ACTN